MKQAIYTVGIDKTTSIRLSAYCVVMLFIGGAIFTSLIGESTNGGNKPIIDIGCIYYHYFSA